MNRYLFLDIDGVLNSSRTVHAYNKIVHSNLVKYRIDSNEPLASMFDPIAVGLLKAAQEKLNFKIVISSTWKLHLSIDEFNLIFADYGWDTKDIIIGKTDSEPGIRGKQIKRWLDNHAKYPHQYCIIDDSADMLVAQEDCFVKTDLNDGLNWEAFLKIFKVFGEKFNEDDLIVSY